MSKVQLDEMGVFMVLKGPPQDKLSRALWASIYGRRKLLVAFRVMPGFLFEEDGKRVIEPLLQEPVSLLTAVTGVNQEMGASRKPWMDCVVLSTKVDHLAGKPKPFPQFAHMPLCSVLARGSYFDVSYNMQTSMGGIILAGQRSHVTAQDFWTKRTADGWYVSSKPQPAKETSEDQEFSSTAW